LAPSKLGINAFVNPLVFTDHIPINYSGVGIAAGILMLVVLMTVSIQIRKVLKSIPLNGLKAD
jgi:hypothetical protein